MRETTLNAMNIFNGFDLRWFATELIATMTEKEYTFFMSCSLGLGQTRHADEINEDDAQKGISVSETFTRPCQTQQDFKDKIVSLTQQLASRI